MSKLARNLSDKTGVVVDHLAQQDLRSDAAKRKTPRLVRALLIESVKSELEPLNSARATT